jgi:PKD repeat protein
MAPPVTRDVPPEALFSLSPTVGNPLTVFTVNANPSSDYEDPLGLLQVRWSWDGGASWGPWTTAKSAAHTYSTPGDYAIRLEVLDTAGLTDNWTAAVTVTPKPDNTPPVIVSAPPASVDVGQPLRVFANVTDAGGIANVTLLYRGVSDTGFTAVPMGILNGTNFTATIPGQPHAGTVEYVIVANDSWGNEARAPLSGSSSVLVVDPVINALVFWVLPAALGAAAVGVAAYLVLRRRHKASPPEDSGPPPGNP